MPQSRKPISIVDGRELRLSARALELEGLKEVRHDLINLLVELDCNISVLEQKLAPPVSATPKLFTAQTLVGRALRILNPAAGFRVISSVNRRKIK